MINTTRSDLLGPADIERLSFATIDAEVPEPRPFSGRRWAVVRRLIHTSADFEMLSLVRFSPGAVEAGVTALRAGAAIVTDTNMVRVGIPQRRLAPLGCRALCLMDDPEIAARAAKDGTTRARAAVDAAAALPGPLVFAVGNAPTALLRILELVAQERLAPALVIGMPVGFVNAAESKDLLMDQDSVPFVTIRGRKGGSTLAAACVNALLILAQEEEEEE